MLKRVPRRAKSATDSGKLSAYLNGRVEDLRRLVPRALNSWDAAAIHQARVTTRRLKAAIDLLEPVLPSARRRRFTKSLRRLRKALGPLRDADVMLEHIAEFSRGHERVVDWLRERLQQRRLELRRQCARDYSSKDVLDGLGNWWSFEHEVAEAEAAAQSLLRRAVHGQLKAFGDRADRLELARQKKSSSSESRDTASDDDVHSLRIAGKLLRYTLELSEPAGNTLPSAVLRSFKQLQEALGGWHDYVVLGEAVLRAALRVQLPAHHDGLYGEVLELAGVLWKRSERDLDKFAQLWRKHGKEINKSIVNAFGATAPKSTVAKDDSDEPPHSGAPTAADQPAESVHSDEQLSPAG